MKKVKKAMTKPRIIPFTTMDEAMLHGSSARHHSNVHVEVRAPGKLDAGRVSDAVNQAMQDHPLARARQVDHKASEHNFQWEILPQATVDPLVVVEAGSEAMVVHRREQLLNMQPSLNDAPPFYVWLVRRARGDSLIFNFNHVVGDGIGVLHFLRSVVANYAGRKDAHVIDPVAAREATGISSGGRDKKAQQQNQLEMMRRTMYKAIRIAPDGARDCSGYGCRQLIIDKKEFKQLDTKKYIEATVNDVLLAGMHKTIELWNAEHGGESGQVRVQTPVNLRPAKWQNEVLGNFIGSFPTNTLESERSDPGELMATVNEQARGAKDTGFAEVMYETMQYQDKLPIFIKNFLMPGLLSSSSTSACVSNLGRVPGSLDFGPEKNAREVWVSPPAGLATGLGLGALGYNGSLFLAFRYANDLLDASAAERFVDLYRDTLHWLA